MSTAQDAAEDADILRDPDVLSATAGEVVNAPNGKPIWTVDQIVDWMDRDHRIWNSSGGAIPYSFLESAAPGSSASAFIAFTEAERNFAREAFKLIADIANVRFVELPDIHVSFGQSTRITFSQDDDSQSFEWGRTRLSFDFGIPRTLVEAADTTINPDVVNTRQWVLGGYNFKALMHEIMHALGVPHPGLYNATTSTAITYAESAEFFQDSAQYTVMSYFGADNTGADHIPDSRNVIFSGATPLLYDIAVLQKIYGANTATRQGDTTYGFNSTAGRDSYDFTVNTAPIVCIWDGGGTDCLDLSGTDLASSIDLNQGAFSSAFTMTKNISIAYGVDIENARGGQGSDVLVGNALANRLEGLAGADSLQGGAGADTLDGGTGVDTAIYSGSSKDYAWWSISDTVWTIRDLRDGAPDGKDSLLNIEQIQFTDRTVKIGLLSNLDKAGMAFENMLRYAPTSAADAAYIDSLTARLNTGELSQAQMVRDFVQKAAATTSVASMAYQFFVGAIPSKAGFEYLVAPDGPNPNNLNSAYYQAFSLENRFINFAVNLGKLGEGKAGFQADYGAKSLFDAAAAAYQKIFGTAPSADKVHAILDAVVGGAAFTRADYFAAYGGDGTGGIGTKAAMVGWLLAEAEKADIGLYARANDAFLTDLADGADYAIDLVGVYGKPEFIVSG